MKYKIKIFPEIGDTYIIEFENSNSNSNIEVWIQENLNFVEHYEIIKED